MQTPRPSSHARQSRQPFRYPTPTTADEAEDDDMKGPHDDTKGTSPMPKSASVTSSRSSTSGSEHLPQMQTLHLEPDVRPHPQIQHRHRTRSAESISAFNNTGAGTGPIRIRRSDSTLRSNSSSSTFRPDPPEYRRSPIVSLPLNEHDSRYYPYPRVYHQSAQQYPTSPQYSTSQQFSPSQPYSPPIQLALPPQAHPQYASAPPVLIPFQPSYPYPPYPYTYPYPPQAHPHTHSMPTSPDASYYRPQQGYWAYPQSNQEYYRPIEPMSTPASVVTTDAEEAYPPGFKPKRKRADANQTRALNEVFKSNRFPKTELRQQLAHQLKMTSRTVQIWFQNKRQSEKAKETQAEGKAGETEGASSDVLASGAVGQQQASDEDEGEGEVEEDEDEFSSQSPHGQHYDAIRDVISGLDSDGDRNWDQKSATDSRKGKGKAAE